jgi:outer membrane protein assembly factor BamD (BamD/ComL family)
MIRIGVQTGVKSSQADEFPSMIYHPPMAARWLGGLLLAALLAPMTPQGWAQDQYLLNDEDLWEQISILVPDSPASELAEARRALADGAYERAQTLATQWIEAYPDDSLMPEAYLVRADAKMGDKDYYKSLFDYEYIARQFPASEAFVTAAQRELEIAKLFTSGVRRKGMGLRLFSAVRDGEELLIRIQERLPQSAIAEDAGITLADFYFKRRDMELATEAYSLFIENYPYSPRVSMARRRLIYAQLASFKGPQFDATGLYEARLQILSLKAIEPATAEKIGADALIVRIDESAAKKMLVTALWYRHRNDYIATEFTIRRLIKRYPRSIATADALRLLPSILARLPESVLARIETAGIYPPSVFKDRKPLAGPPAEGAQPTPEPIEYAPETAP